MRIADSSLADAAGILAEQAQQFVVQVRGRGRGHGSGIVWHHGASILTNFHVVAGLGNDLEILTHAGQRYAARVQAGNPRLDLALLLLDNVTLAPATLGASQTLRVGELVFAIGDPWGQRGVVTAGIVSGLGEIPGAREEIRASYIRSDVRLAPGNSGGPLLNARGEVVGINAMIFGGDLAVSIPAHVAAEWAARLPSRTAYLGLGVQPISVSTASKQVNALLIAAVTSEGPAAHAGLHRGDVLLNIDNVPVENSDSLIQALAQHNPGDTVRLMLLRDSEPLSIDVILTERAD